MAFNFLKIPQSDLEEFADSIKSLKTKTKYCRVCLNLTEKDICSVCSDSKRDRSIITVVEDVLDLLSFEIGEIYNGVYHVLHGRIDPLNNMGPEDIKIKELLERVKEIRGVREIILATNPDMEGEATAIYIKNKLHELKGSKIKELKITRLGYGLPIGANLEYADYMTLKKAIENRNKY